MSTQHYLRNSQRADPSSQTSYQCASAETQATFSLTEGVEEHWSAGPARPGSSPAASLTAGWRYPWQVLEPISLAGLEHLEPVTERSFRGGRNGNLSVHRRSIPWPEVPGETPLLVRGSRNGNSVVHRHSIHGDEVVVC